jgi:branched-chain amino acid transport system permease protein
MSFLLETVIGGVLVGTLYALVAIGFVLVYKTSGAFNYAQGSLVLCAALTFVSLVDKGLAPLLAGAITLVLMVLIAIAIERVVLRQLINQSQVTLFMATLGLSFVIEGLSQFFMGSTVHQLDLGIEDLPIRFGDVLISRLDLLAAATAAVLVVALSLFFNHTRIGIAVRAVADDPLAALSVGIRLSSLYRIVWAVTGGVALVAGLLWGARQGVQFSLTLVVLKALPVLIIGGFTSISGAIIGGLIIGVGENLAEIYISPLAGGSVSNWFAYVLATGFLLIKPEGIFGEPAINRV